MRTALATLAAVLVVATLAPGAALGACAQSGQTTTCTHTADAVQTVVVPADVTGAIVHVRGGAGSRNNHHIAPGGAAGTVDAMLPVDPGQLLDVYVADSGYGSRWGRASGGDHGVAPGSSQGYSGGYGGGASAVAEHGELVPLLVGGGGGGGGGDGGFSDWLGGAGGAGAGGDGAGDSGGANGGNTVPMVDGPPIGGAGGGAGGLDGNSGQDTTLSFQPFVGAGGGGGGGYPDGGDGGGVYWYQGPFSEGKSYGGGGGGGGDSYAGALAQNPVFAVSDSPCPEGGGTSGNDPGCQGLVTLTWMATPARVAPAAGGGQSAVVGTEFAQVLQALVTAADGGPAAGATVTFQLPAAGPSAAFQSTGTLLTATAVTDDNGLAASPPFVAGDTVGDWTATATVTGLDAPATFALRNRSAATTTAVSAPTGLVAGQSTHLTATVATARTDLGVPGGRVQFGVDGRGVGAPATLDAAGNAASPALALDAGTHELSAEYLGDDPFGASAGTATTTVSRAIAVVSVDGDPNPSADGQTVALTATVTAAGASTATPSGSVRFLVDGAAVGSATLAAGSATLDHALASGTHDVVAQYSGDDAVAAGTGSTVQAVGPAATAVLVRSSDQPSVAGTPPTFSARLQTGGGGAPVGAVTFSSGAAVLCADIAPVATGPDESTATCTPLAGALAVGTSTITAAFAGVPPYADGRGSLVQRVIRAATTTSVDVTPASAFVGQTLTLHADVSGASPSGAVRFALDGLPIGDPLTLGPTGATLEWSPPGGRLTAGAHVVQATYGGDQDDEGSTGSAIAHVSPALTTTTLTSAANPAAAGQPLSWTASVQIAGPGPARPAGAVGFVVDGRALGAPVALDARGVAQTAAPALSTGTHDVRAVFQDSQGDFATSRALLLQQVTTGPRPPAPPSPPSPPSTPSAPPAVTPVPGPSAASEGERPSPLLCGPAMIAITELRPQGRRVRLMGIARERFVGRRVTISVRGRRVARSTVRADGTFATWLPRPAGQRWRLTRYRAEVDGQRTRAMKLTRLLHVTGRSAAGADRVRVTLKLDAPGRHALVLGRQESCSARASTRLRTVRTDARGRVSVTLARPPRGAGPAAYRLWTSGRPITFSLPIVVRARP